MKIATKKLPYEKAAVMKRPPHRNPLRPMFLLQIVVRILSIFDLWPTKFTYTQKGMEQLGKKEPCLILMNHSSFIDLKIASRIFFPGVTASCVPPTALWAPLWSCLCGCWAAFPPRNSSAMWA